MIKHLFIFLLCLMPASLAGAETSTLPDAILVPGQKPGYVLVVDKAEQVLYVYLNKPGQPLVLERVMACSTGAAKGDKLERGDRKTPNGFYIFNQKLLPRELSDIYGILAYPMDYPNFWDKNLKRGGDGIWLHGINKPLTDYDSNGCIEVENHNLAPMEEFLTLYDTPVIVYEKLSVADTGVLAAEGQEVLAFVEGWRTAWVNKNMAAYRSKYDENFVNSDQRPYNAWMSHKEKLFHQYKSIAVELKNIKVFRHRDVLVVLFEQYYSGDKSFTSAGLKRLYLRKSGDSYKIVGEEFSDLIGQQPNKWLTAEEKRTAIETPPLTQVAALAETGRRELDADLRASQEAQAAAAAKAAAEAKAKADALVADKAHTEAVAQAAAEAKAKADAKAKTDARAKADAQAETDAIKLAQAKMKAQQKAAKEEQARAATENKNELQALTTAWATAWSSKDIDAYFAYYADNFIFKDKNMNLKQFISYRRSLIEKAELIEIGISEIKVDVADDKAQVVFLQKYRSDGLSDVGYKTLEFTRNEEGQWQIISEAWRKKESRGQ